jgi:hypothetical protein
VTHSYKPFDEDAIRRGACKEPETACLYLVYAEQTVESPAALQYVSESETARSADLFNSTSKIIITNVPHKDVLFKLLPPADDPPDSSTPAPSAAPAGNANRAGGPPLRAARADASRAAYNPRPDAEEHNRMATDLDAHMTSAGSFTPGSRLESIDDAQRRQLQRSLAKMNELPLPSLLLPVRATHRPVHSRCAHARAPQRGPAQRYDRLTRCPADRCGMLNYPSSGDIIRVNGIRQRRDCRAYRVFSHYIDKLISELSDSEIRLGDWQTFQKFGAAGARCVPTMVGRAAKKILRSRQPFLIGKWPRTRRHTACRRTAEFASRTCCLPFYVHFQNGGSNAAQGSDQVQVDLYHKVGRQCQNRGTENGV